MSPLDRSFQVGRSLAEEFKAFALKGNVIDLAVGVIIGGAFGKIVESLVKNLIMPAVSIVLPTNESYRAWKLTMNGQDVPYGLFLGDVVNFVILAAALFVLVVKLLGWVMRNRAKESAAPAPAPAAPPPSREQELLAEIRDLLRART